MKFLVAGSGTGMGVAVNNKTKATTYMKAAGLAPLPDEQQRRRMADYWAQL